jgi:hypothetical protein
MCGGGKGQDFLYWKSPFMKRSEHNNLKQKQVHDVKFIPYDFNVSNVKLGVV